MDLYGFIIMGFAMILDCLGLDHYGYVWIYASPGLLLLELSYFIWVCLRVVQMAIGFLFSYWIHTKQY